VLTRNVTCQTMLGLSVALLLIAVATTLADDPIALSDPIDWASQDPAGTYNANKNCTFLREGCDDWVIGECHQYTGHNCVISGQTIIIAGLKLYRRRSIGSIQDPLPGGQAKGTTARSTVACGCYEAYRTVTLSNGVYTCSDFKCYKFIQYGGAGQNMCAPITT